MRILIVIDQYDDSNNGTTISAQRFANGLKNAGHEVFIISTGKPNDYKTSVKPIHLTPIVSYIVRSQGMRFAMPNKSKLREAISKVDIVHFYMPFFLSNQGVKIAEELGVPHTAAFHVQPENITYTIGLGENKKINNYIYTFFNKHFYNKFNHIHCPSQFIANQLKEHGYTAKTHIISNGVDDDFKYIKSDKPTELEDKFVITMIGRYSNEKRQDVLIDAISKSKYENKIQLVLAGKGPKENSYKNLGKKLTNTPIMEFYTKEDLITLLSYTDLYVHAADAEIEAISCIEAFACGLVPIIANSSNSATPQFALNENSLFEAGNSEDLAKKIDYWIENPIEKKQMEIEYSKSAEKYRLSNSIKQIERMFEDAIIESNS